MSGLKYQDFFFLTNFVPAEAHTAHARGDGAWARQAGRAGAAAPARQRRGMFGIGASAGACGVGVQLKKNGDGSVIVGGLAPGGPAQAQGQVRVDDVIEQVRSPPEERGQGARVPSSADALFPVRLPVWGPC